MMKKYINIKKAPIIVVIILVIGIIIWQLNFFKSKNGLMNNYKSPTVNVLQPVKINSAADLNSALKSINQTNLDSNIIDNKQLNLLLEKF